MNTFVTCTSNRPCTRTPARVPDSISSVTRLHLSERKLCWTKRWRKVKHGVYSKYTFPFSLTVFEITSPEGLVTLWSTEHSVHSSVFCPHNLFHVLYVTERRLFCCKTLSDWLLCLKRNVFTAHYEINIYIQGYSQVPPGFPTPAVQ